MRAVLRVRVLVLREVRLREAERLVLREDERVVLREALRPVVLRAAVRLDFFAPDLLLEDRFRLVITKSPCVGWVNGFLLSIFGRRSDSLTSTGAVL